jgi:hypothetical protein
LIFFFAAVLICLAIAFLTLADFFTCLAVFDFALIEFFTNLFFAGVRRDEEDDLVLLLDADLELVAFAATLILPFDLVL